MGISEEMPLRYATPALLDSDGGHCFIGSDGPQMSPAKPPGSFTVQGWARAVELSAIVRHIHAQGRPLRSWSDVFQILVQEYLSRHVLTADASIEDALGVDRKSTRLNSSHSQISYA